MTPKLWRRLLLPLVPVYRLGLSLRAARLGTRLEPVRRLRFPVVSIGNLSTGGSGKTPLTIALARAITRHGIQVDVLSRGYGRLTPAASRVDPAGASEQFGDEPLLIACQAFVPVFVANERFKAGQLAEAAFDGGDCRDSIGAISNVHILDDGFQHRQLARDVDILLIDRFDWEDHLLPAGNLREPVAAARRAHVIAIPANDGAFEAELRAWGWKGPIWRLRRAMEIPALEGHVLAFCGIARPRQFFAGLETAGVRLVERVEFPDHHAFTKTDVERLLAKARAAGAGTLLTTEKDSARLGSLAAGFPPALPLKTVGLHVEIEDEDKAIQWLLDRLQYSLQHSLQYSRTNTPM